MGNEIYTPFSAIYDRFLLKTTEDLYLEITREETLRDLEGILINAIPKFEFPRFAIFDYDLSKETLDENGDMTRGAYRCILTQEEINILSDLMVIEWLSRQLASVDNTRMKYSGSDFKFTSQANHMEKLRLTKDSYISVNIHAQRLYKRRKIENGRVKSNLSGLGGGVFKSGRN